MRVYAGQGALAVANTAAPRRPAAASFRLDASPAKPEAGAASAPRSLGGIETLLALQGFEDPAARRRRVVAGGHGALGALEELKLALLSGTPDPNAMARLRNALAGTRERTGEDGLDEVLDHIELRLEVEIAKLERG